LTNEPADRDLDSQVRRLDPDRWLASRFVGDPAARADLIALYAFDHELARAPRVASNPLVAEIRLSWWREVLDEAYQGRPVRKHPTALALADAIRRRVLPREPLEAMIDARLIEVDGGPSDLSQALTWAVGVGGGAMRAAALILDPAAPAEATAAAGRAWGLARHPQIEGIAAARDAALAEARRKVRGLSVAAFPAVLPLVAQCPGGDLAKRLRLTWAAATGRV
jgi:phytoene synthase